MYYSQAVTNFLNCSRKDNLFNMMNYSIYHNVKSFTNNILGLKTNAIWVKTIIFNSSKIEYNMSIKVNASNTC